MKKELDYFLVKRFPNIFKNRYASASESCMSWGFECDDGWFQILYQACSLIENHIQNIEENNKFRLKMKNEIESGKEVYDVWKEKYEKDGLEPDPVPEFIASQVKEKFGTLRFYYEGGDDYISAIINFAESESCHTCEVCGRRGKTRHGGWIRTLCDEHAKAENRDIESKIKIEEGSMIYALVQGNKKTFIIKEIKNEKEFIAKEKIENYDKEKNDYIISESEEEYLIKYYETEVFSYYDATKL